MRQIWTRVALTFVVVALAATPALTQTFANYRCDDGTPIGAVFFSDTKTVALQYDGKSITLPYRIAISGTRYKKSGVTFWIKRDKVYFKRPKARETVCRIV